MYADLFQPNLNLLPTVQLPTRPRTTNGSVPPLDESAAHEATGGLFGLITRHKDLTILVSSPNMEAMVDPLYGWRTICLRSNFTFGLEDCFVSPQIWRSRVGHLATIPWPSPSSSLSETHWKVFGEDCFQRHGAEDPILRRLGLFVLQASALEELKECCENSRARFNKIEDEWSLGRSQLTPWGDPPARALYHQHQVLLDRLHAPAESEQLTVRVRRLQRTILELHGRLNWMEVLPLLRDPPSKPMAVRDDWIGALCGSEEIADRMYRASIPVWLVRKGINGMLPENVKQWDEEAPSRKRVCSIPLSIFEGEYDPFRPPLGLKSAGDLTRYALMDDCLAQLSHPNGKISKGQESASGAAVPYFESLRDRRLDLRIPRASLCAERARLHPNVPNVFGLEGATSDLEFFPGTSEVDSVMHGRRIETLSMQSPSEVAGDNIPMESSEFAPSADSSLLDVEPISSTALPSTRTLRHNTPSRRLKAQVPQRPGYLPPGTQDRDKFVDDTHPDLPRMCDAWANTSRRVRDMTMARRVVGAPMGTFLMDPNVLVRQDDVKFKTALKLHDILVLRLELPLPLVGVLRPKEWNWILGFEVLNEPGKGNTQSHKRRDSALKLLQTAIAIIPHGQYIDLNHLHEVEPRWHGRLVDKVHPQDRREFCWEVGEANFRCELLLLDQKRYRLCKRIKDDIREDVEEGQDQERSWLDSTSWDERQSKLYALFPHWRSSLAPNITQAGRGFASPDFGEAGKAVLGLWQLMCTWEDEGVQDEESVRTVRELEQKLFLSRGGHKNCDDLLKRATEVVSCRYILNFVNTFGRAPFLPRRLR
ncbi:hypothetical protein CYLTODRAFT_458912 [Cylindrobasidium torrendii FP15055 ss-10]|uniref:Uncharacterized protein n=1 Tax=Cylindrobasidium torrendii FP15055 ss-10 TaxID=1314674 RepID=A0A0D7AWZ7_9AGAR|nr:hypothetical protein CYLTODRAFT_458912 [Cylindrobasidium torrendii FP15055 ss-10]